MYKSLSQRETQTLTRFLADPKRPEGTLVFHELQGFLFAVASSPELVMPSDWQPMISNDEAIGYQDEAEAQEIIGLIMKLYNTINAGVLERSDRLPQGCEFKDEVADNFDEHQPIAQWSHGFMIGHDWLSEVWDEYLPEEFDGDLSSAAMVLSFFSSRRLAEAYHQEFTTTPQKRKPRVGFDDYAAKVRELFPPSLSAYAHIGRSISEVLAGRSGPGN